MTTDPIRIEGGEIYVCDGAPCGMYREDGSDEEKHVPLPIVAALRAERARADAAEAKVTAALADCQLITDLSCVHPDHTSQLDRAFYKGRLAAVKIIKETLDADPPGFLHREEPTP